jgi:hypothetical protein
MKNIWTVLLVCVFGPRRKFDIQELLPVKLDEKKIGDGSGNENKI